MLVINTFQIWRKQNSTENVLVMQPKWSYMQLIRSGWKGKYLNAKWQPSRWGWFFNNSLIFTLRFLMDGMRCWNITREI